MRPSWLAILFLTLFSTAAVAWDDPSAAVAATYRPADKKLLASSFVSAVNTWLDRYERSLVTQNPGHVRMPLRLRLRLRLRPRAHRQRRPLRDQGHGIRESA
jgi:hypothetical protein